MGELREVDLLQKVENAAKEGARAGSSGSRTSAWLYRFVIFALLLAVAGGFVYLYNRLNNGLTDIKEQFEIESASEAHDLVLEDDGFLGYTAADFAEAILGRPERLKKLEVLTREVTDMVTITDTGLGNLKMFTKAQCLTYHGIVTYTVDLGEINENSVVLDEAAKKVVLYVPHAVLEPINIPSDKIEFGEVKKGALAFGNIEITPEQTAEVQTEAQHKMEEKLKAENTIEEADRLARLSVWEIFQPIISSTAPGYTLEVVLD